MLLNLNKVNWSHSLKLKDYESHKASNIDTMKTLKRLTGQYNKWIQEENKETTKEFVVSSVGKMNPKTHLMSNIDDAMNENVMECLGTMINTVVF
jgi:26S proteasome regulatory subunit N11